MSQKPGKRSRRSTTDSDSSSQFKLPSVKNVNNNKDIKEDHENGTNNDETVKCNQINGNNETTTTTTTSTTTVEVEVTERITRSRSSTPQIKPINGQEDSSDNQTSTLAEQSTTTQQEIIIEEIDPNTEEKLNEDKEICEMDPLVLDEPDPELVFDETSDYDGGSGKSSPILNRCVTRRSQTRNIPTPKTPQQLLQQKDENEERDDEEAEGDDAASSVAPPSSSCITRDGDGDGGGGGSGGGGDGGDDLSSTFETCDNLSTKAETGSDTTRFNYLNNNTTTIVTSEPSTFLLESKDRSFTETLRSLSSRRSLRPTYDYRRKIFNKIDKNDLNSSAPSSSSFYPSRRESIERVSIGNKRKLIDEHDTTTLKRFKLDTSGLWSKLTSPITNIRGSFKRSDLPSSTPKLTGYKDEKLFVEDGSNGEREEQTEDVNEKRWCIIM